jgi:hypothetical protein
LCRRGRVKGPGVSYPQFDPIFADLIRHEVNCLR